MRTLVVYHSADMDGKFSGAVCYHWLKKHGHDVTLKGWDFGDPPIDGNDYVYADTSIYVVDLPPDAVEIEDGEHASFFWIDHHKSSIEKYPESLCGLRIDGVAACRLAWYYFQTGAEGNGTEWAVQKSEFVNRQVKEPLALTLVGEYDVWDKRDPMAEQFQFGLYSETDWTPEKIAAMFFGAPNNGQVWVESLAAAGEVIMKWQKVFASSVCKHRGYKVELGGNTYWTLASVHARNSSWFPPETVPEECNGLMCYRIEGDGQVKVSLYNRPGHEHIDHSVIAVAHGGGGHKGACGFSLTLGQAIMEGIVC